jgi:hypothetical protein
MAKFLVLIKKMVNKKIQNQDQHDIKENVCQEVFMKLLQKDFFDTHTFEGPQEDIKKFTSYISFAVNSAYVDELLKLGLSHRSSRDERMSTGHSYISPKNHSFDDIGEHPSSLHQADTSIDKIFAEEAYLFIQHCFELTARKYINDNHRMFYETAFWGLAECKMSIKDLATHLGFTSTNPTQAFNRFARKVSTCTQQHGITLKSPNDKIQILLEIMAPVELIQ